MNDDQRKIMQAAGEALEADRLGRTPTTPCPVCGIVLKVMSNREAGVVYVTCDSGCTQFRMRFHPG